MFIKIYHGHIFGQGTFPFNFGSHPDREWNPDPRLGIWTGSVLANVSILIINNITDHMLY